MKVGVIADIHSNQTAFRACVDYMVNAGCEGFLLLGDFISDTAGARQTMELLYELMEQFPCHVLRGNREEYMIEQRKIREKEEEEKFWPANSASGNQRNSYTLSYLRDKNHSRRFFPAIMPSGLEAFSDNSINSRLLTFQRKL